MYPTPITYRRRALVLMLAGVLALAASGLMPGRALGWSPCFPHSTAPSSDGLWASGVAFTDCPSPYIADWLKGELVEWVFPGAYLLRDASQHNGNSGNHISTSVSYYCNGHGTDDWQLKANVRDLQYGEYGWVWGLKKSLSC